MAIFINFGQIWAFVISQIVTNNLAIWSHWTSVKFYLFSKFQVAYKWSRLTWREKEILRQVRMFPLFRVVTFFANLVIPLIRSFVLSQNFQRKFWLPTTSRRKQEAQEVKGGDSQSSRVTRWIDYFSIFGHLHQWKFPQLHEIMPK